MAKWIWFALFMLIVTVVLLIILLPFSNTGIVYNDNIGNMMLDHMSAPGQWRYSSKHQDISAFFERFCKCFCKTTFQTSYPYPEIPFYRHAKYYGQTGLRTDAWHFFEDSQTKLAYWDQVSSELRKCINYSLEDVNKTSHDVVIHMRCSDVPFQEKGHGLSLYHIQTLQYYDWALQHLNVTDEEEITVLATHKWKGNTENETVCHKWTNQLVKHLEQKNFRVRIQSESILQDFATLFYSKKSIGSCSSFCFMASIGKPLFVMPMLGAEQSGTYVKPGDIPSWMCPLPPILHKNVPDYYVMDLVAQ